MSVLRASLTIRGDNREYIAWLWARDLENRNETDQWIRPPPPWTKQTNTLINPHSIFVSHMYNK